MSVTSHVDVKSQSLVTVPTVPMPFLGLHRAEKVLPEVPSLFHVEISTLIKTEVPIIIFDASLVCILEDPASQGRAFVPGLDGDPKGLVDQSLAIG